MNKEKMTEKKSVSLSYIDLFFLLLAGLILSLGIYAMSESRAQSQENPQYRVELSAIVPTEFSDWIPREGEEIYNRAGEKIGQVQFLSTSPVYEGNQVHWICLLDRDPPKLGEEFVMESTRSVLKTSVLSVTEQKREEVNERE